MIRHECQQEKGVVLLPRMSITEPVLRCDAGPSPRSGSLCIEAAPVVKWWGRWLSRTYQLLVYNSYLYRSCEVCEPDYSWHPASHCEENCWKPGKSNLDRWRLFWQNKRIMNLNIILGGEATGWCFWATASLRSPCGTQLYSWWQWQWIKIWLISNLEVFLDPSNYLYRTWVLTVRGVRGRGELVTEPAWRPILNKQWPHYELLWFVRIRNSWNFHYVNLLLVWNGRGGREVVFKTCRNNGCLEFSIWTGASLLNKF